MRVTIKTENGFMNVDLEKFFPTSLVRTRKLFRLMGEGLSDSDREAAREYLRSRGNKDRIVSELRSNESELRRVEAYLEKLKSERNIAESQRRGINARIRALKQEEKAAAVRLREFDYICGDPEKS